MALTRLVSSNLTLSANLPVSSLVSNLRLNVRSFFYNKMLSSCREACSTRSIPALILMALLLAAGASEGASDSREIVQASEILAAIER